MRATRVLIGYSLTGRILHFLRVPRGLVDEIGLYPAPRVLQLIILHTDVGVRAVVCRRASGLFSGVLLEAFEPHGTQGYRPQASREGTPERFLRGTIETRLPGA